MPPKKKGVFTGGYGSGVDTETEEPPSAKKPPTTRLSKRQRYEQDYGKGRRISDSEHSGLDKPRRANASPARRSTRSTSKQPRGPPPPAKAAPMPTPPTTKSKSRSPARKRGRAPPATERTKSPEKTTASPAKNRPPRRARTVSPAKRLIADSPPPEDRMDPFPKQPEPMTVSDKPAVRNRYGEKVPAPVDLKQKMRQAVNFLSDEGVENCADFKEKLESFKTWFHENHPRMDGIIPEGQDDVEMLCRRVEYMIWVHERRIQEGSEQWFTRDQFPDSKSMVKPVRPAKGDQWRLHPDGTTTNKSKHPKLQVMLADDRERAAKDRAEKAAAAKASPKKKAAAAPTPQRAGLPYPEVWHRKEARRFPYGETPYMEQVMSRQITADLARGREAREALQGGSIYFLKRTLGNLKKYLYSDDNAAAPFDPWKLPEVTDEDVWDADKKYNYLGTKVESTGTKRKARTQPNKSPPKRTRSGAWPASHGV